MAVLCWGGSVVSCTESALKVNGEEKTTSLMERRLFLFFLNHPDCALPRELLLREVWGYNEPGITRTVDTHIKLLRSHLGNLGSLISTVRGVGYRLDVCHYKACLCTEKVAC